ncbi:DUF6279 family lipoprotein [Kaarinaea lacus]
MKLSLRTKSIACLVCCALILSGCGIRILYNQLDWLIPYYVDDYITLDESQQAELDKRLADVINWHRTTQLAEYSAFLRKTSKDIQEGVTEEKLDYVFNAAETSWRNLINKVTPELVDILLGATEEQKQELFDNIEKRNQDFKDDYLNLEEEERREERVEAMQENFERWMGSLTEEQEKIIAHYASNFIPIHNDRWLFRMRWQEEFKKLIYDDPQNPEVRKKLEHLFVDPSDLYTPEYKNKRIVNKKLIKEMIIKMKPTMQDEQFTYLYKKIEKYAAIFEELSVET